MAKFFLERSPGRRDKLAQRRDQMRDVVLQPGEAGGLLDGLLVHVERAVDLDLQAVTMLGRPALPSDDLDALVNLVDAHVIAAPAQDARDKFGEVAAAGGAVAIAEYKVGAVAFLF